MGSKIKQFKQGGASIFLVIVSCIFVSVIVASFVRLMIRDQEQASNQDLSQSAYDSAQAGVEDAKRFLNIWMNECQSGGNLSTEHCQAMTEKISKNDDSCNILNAVGIGAASGETMIQSKIGDNSQELNQAYTCVKLNMNTSDYLGELSKEQSVVIRLKPTQTAYYLRLSWHTKKDSNAEALNLEDKKPSDSIALPNTWQKDRPAVLEAQLSGVNYGVARTIEQYDDSFNNGTGSGKVTLYPSKSANAYDNSNSTIRTLNFQVAGGADATRRNDTSSQKVYPAKCATSLATGGYACSLKIKVPELSAAPTQYTLLRLATLYTGTNYKVEMLDASGNAVQFDGIQPKVDSTGRANDRFRRIETRLSTSDLNFPIPDFALYQSDENTQLCKDFWVTNTKNKFECE